MKNKTDKSLWLIPVSISLLVALLGSIILIPMM